MRRMVLVPVQVYCPRKSSWLNIEDESFPCPNCGSHNHMTQLSLVADLDEPTLRWEPEVRFEERADRKLASV